MTTEAYIEKNIAASMLGLKPRRTLELCTLGLIRKRESYNPKTKRRQTLLLEADVRREAARRQIAARANGAMTRASDYQAAEPSHPEEDTAPPPRGELIPATLHEFRWLTLREASAYSGLPVPVLHRLVRHGGVRVIDCGRHCRGGRFRIQRCELDGLRGQFWQVQFVSTVTTA